MDTGAVMQLVTALSAAVAAIYGYMTRRVGRSIEDAVNHRHTNGQTTPRLYDLALENQERTEYLQHHIARVEAWMDQYQGGPLDTNDKVVRFLELNQADHDAIMTKLGLKSSLEAHEPDLGTDQD